MRILRKAVLLGFALIVVIVFVAIVAKQRGTQGLKAEIVATNSDIGIPGITKMYGAKLTNRGLLPVRVTRCNFIDDAMAPGTMVAYAVQRWDEGKKRWQVISENGRSSFCKPYPLGILKAHLEGGWLWPGQSLSTNEEASAASDAFRIGDHARFVVFPRDAGDYGSGIATADFIIDEHPGTNINLRISH
jgi:hypothetical protein